jgi:hypothetical protein
MESIMLSSGAIADRVEKLASDISLDYVDRTISIICILKGLSMFLIPFDFPYNTLLVPNAGAATFTNNLSAALLQFHNR